MTTASIHLGGRNWRFAELPEVRDPDRVQAIARVQILDDISLLAPTTPLKVTSNCTFPAAAGPGGLIGLVGRPSQYAPDAQIAGTAVAFTVTAAGYEDLSLSSVLPAQPALPPPPPPPIVPAKFQLLDFGQRRLIRANATIQGRVFRRIAGVFQPLVGAVVTITAATAAPTLAGATPLPISVAGYVGTTSTTTADAEYRFAMPLPRFSTLTLQVTSPALSPPVVIVAPAAGSNVTQDFRL
jgi:hypothetical protein